MNTRSEILTRAHPSQANPYTTHCGFARELNHETYDLRLLEKSFNKWRRSPAVRLIYGNIFRHMEQLATPGAALEIGSGCGVIREFISKVVTSDVCKTRFVDHQVSAYEIETLAGEHWKTVYALDVLHHLKEPLRFFSSAGKALVPGGRVVICDPAATLLGRFFYRAFHHEPICRHQIAKPYVFSPDPASNEFANMAMAWSLFVRDREPMATILSSYGLSIRLIHFRDVMAYPASGGFSAPSILPHRVLHKLLFWESLLPQPILRLIALRMIVVLEKVTASDV